LEIEIELRRRLVLLLRLQRSGIRIGGRYSYYL